MANFTAADVKALRDKTGAGMLDCKKALVEANGDVEAAIDWLRAKGIAKAAKKSSRVAAEGLVGVKVIGTVGAIVELNAETDFVSRNEEFQNLVDAVTSIALENASDSLNAETLAGTTCNVNNKPVSEVLTEKIATIGENMTLRRAETISVETGAIAAYVHNKTTDTLGKIGVLVALQSDADVAKLDEIGKQIAMHIAANKPQALSIESLDPEIVQREKDVLTEQARESGKPENIIEKMIQGRISKFYGEVVLLEQPFVMNPDVTVKQMLEQASKELGSEIALQGYVCYRLGEGIEKQAEDFAEEVRKAANG